MPYARLLGIMASSFRAEQQLGIVTTFSLDACWENATIRFPSQTEKTLRTTTHNNQSNITTDTKAVPHCCNPATRPSGPFPQSRPQPFWQRTAAMHLARVLMLSRTSPTYNPAMSGFPTCEVYMCSLLAIMSAVLINSMFALREVLHESLPIRDMRRILLQLSTAKF